MKRSRLVLFAFLIALLIVYVGGCRRAGTWLVREEVPDHADCLVILMGSFPERVLQGYDLYRQGRADRILIVEESMGPFRQLEERGVSIETNSEQAVKSLITLGVPPDSITLLPGDARSTLDEAKAVRKFISANPSTDTLVLVSSPAHMRRASIIFKTVLGDKNESIFIGSSPSTYSGFNPDKWWRRKEDIQSFVTEYLKICSFILFEKRKI